MKLLLLVVVLHQEWEAGLVCQQGRSLTAKGEGKKHHQMWRRPPAT